MDSTYDNIHPPAIVQLNNPIPPSPLKSNPNTPVHSPNKQPRGGFGGIENNSETKSPPPRRRQSSLLPPSRRNRSEVPFDEVSTSKQKKETTRQTEDGADGDVVVGRNAATHTLNKQGLLLPEMRQPTQQTQALRKTEQARKTTANLARPKSDRAVADGTEQANQSDDSGLNYKSPISVSSRGLAIKGTQEQTKSFRKKAEVLSWNDNDEDSARAPQRVSDRKLPLSSQSSSDRTQIKQLPAVGLCQTPGAIDVLHESKDDQSSMDDIMVFRSELSVMDEIIASRLDDAQEEPQARESSLGGKMMTRATQPASKHTVPNTPSGNNIVPYSSPVEGGNNATVGDFVPSRRVSEDGYKKPKSMAVSSLHHPSQTGIMKTYTDSSAVLTPTLLCTSTNEAVEYASGISDDDEREYGRTSAQSDSQEIVSVRDFLFDDAAYFSTEAAKTFAEVGKAGVISLASAGAAVENFVLGPQKAPRTPEEIAAEWRRRKKIKELEAKSAAEIEESGDHGDNTGTLSSGSESGEEASQTDSEDSDDTPVVVNNQKKRLSLSPVGRRRITPKQKTVRTTPTRSLSTNDITGRSPSTGSSVKGASSSGVTGWWLEKELARREQQKKLREMSTGETKPEVPHRNINKIQVPFVAASRDLEVTTTAKESKEVPLTAASPAEIHPNLTNEEVAWADNRKVKKLTKSSLEGGTETYQVRYRLQGDKLDGTSTLTTQERQYSKMQPAAVLDNDSFEESLESSSAVGGNMDEMYFDVLADLAGDEIAMPAPLPPNTPPPPDPPLSQDSPPPEAPMVPAVTLTMEEKKSSLHIPNVANSGVLPAVRASDVVITGGRPTSAEEGMLALNIVADLTNPVTDSTTEESKGLSASNAADFPTEAVDIDDSDDTRITESDVFNATDIEVPIEGPHGAKASSKEISDEESMPPMVRNNDTSEDTSDKNMNEKDKAVASDFERSTLNGKAVGDARAAALTSGRTSMGSSGVEEHDLGVGDDVGINLEKNEAKDQPILTLTEGRDESHEGAQNDIAQDDASESSEGTEVSSNIRPVLVKSLDDINGICKGDIVLSLVHAKASSDSASVTGSVQVKNAVWRMRTMRRRHTLKERAVLTGRAFVEPRTPEPQNSGSRRRSALPVDVDSSRPVGGVRNVAQWERDAVRHLEIDEFDEVLELFEGIYAAYTATFKKREQPKFENPLEVTHYTGNILHNIGIVHFLKSEFTEALSVFEQATEKREAIHETGHPDHVTSLVKTAMCHYALEDFAKAHKTLEKALEIGKGNCKGITDFIQVAEILNNLGCLSFMCSQPGKAHKLFQESLEVQRSVLSHALYGGPLLVGHSTTLNYSITRANIAFLKMCAKENKDAIISFEAALVSQQMLLNDAHETMIATMDHLAVANLLCGQKEKALNMLARMLRAQIEAYGVSDSRCEATRIKIQMVEEKEHKILEAINHISKAHAVRETKKEDISLPPSRKPKNILKKLGSTLRKKKATVEDKSVESSPGSSTNHL